MGDMMNMTRANYPDAAAYCRKWRTLKRIAKTAPHLQVDPFRWFPERADDAYARFLKAMHARINSRGGIKFEGRKHSDIYQTEQMRDCMDIRRNLTQRVIIHERHLRTPEMRRRYDHLVTHHWEI